MDMASKLFTFTFTFTLSASSTQQEQQEQPLQANQCRPPFMMAPTRTRFDGSNVLPTRRSCLQ